MNIHVPDHLFSFFTVPLVNNITLHYASIVHYNYAQSRQRTTPINTLCTQCSECSMHCNLHVVHSVVCSVVCSILMIPRKDIVIAMQVGTVRIAASGQKKHGHHHGTGSI